MAYYDALVAKWATLPPGTIAQKLANINAQTVSGAAVAMVIPTFSIYNVIVPAEFTALNATQQQTLRDILGLGSVDVSSGTQARAVILSIFGAGTATRTALIALAAPYDAPLDLWWQANGYLAPINRNDLVAAGNLS